jgi:hypothetical protein
VIATDAAADGVEGLDVEFGKDFAAVNSGHG